MSPREEKHKKLALFCTPYYLQHNVVEFYRDNSLPLAVTVLFWNLKKNAAKLIFKVSHLNRKCAAAVKCLSSQIGRI